MIKNYLSRILGEKRWTQAELSRRTGIGRNYISELFNENAVGISFDKLDVLCESLDCEVKDLFEYKQMKFE